MKHFWGEQMDIMKTFKMETELTLVDSYMREFLPVTSVDKAVDEIVEAVLESKGKRIRPKMVILAGSYGKHFKESRMRLCQLGAMIEMVHMATLVHDDIIDDSPLRRGLPTIQARFGKDMAVYTGDLILGQVIQTMFRNGFIEAGKALGKTIEEMCRGEIGQHNCQFRLDTTIEKYLQNIYGKTVAMFRLAFFAGGYEGGCDSSVLNVLDQVACHLGYLFQIRDDILDFLSNPEKEGKPDHEDFQAGIFTLPILFAAQIPEYKPQLRAMALKAQSGLLTGDELAELDRILIQSGSMRMAANVMEEHKNKAIEALNALPFNPVEEEIHNLLNKLTIPDFEKNWTMQKMAV